jgi:hypothetical protein
MPKKIHSLLVAATTLAGFTAAFPLRAEARGFHGAIAVHGFYGAPIRPWAYYGFGPYWGPYYGPYGPWAQAGFNPGMAAAAGLGAIDVNVNPGTAEVWVDGGFVAEARDLGGSPNLLWLREGPHHVVVYKGGYRSFEENVAIPLGQKVNLKVHLDKGDSQPPGLRPSSIG